MLVLSAAIASASLTFESQKQDLHVPAEKKEMEVLFPFKNESGERVAIVEYDAPCTCMTAALKGGRKLKTGSVGFLDGETGVIRGKFELGNLKGSVTKKIVLKTRSESGEEDSLSLESTFHIPYLIAAFPNALSWHLGDAPEPKVIQILVDHDEPIQISKVSSSSNQISHVLETVKPGYEYRLTVTPKSTDEFLFAALRIITDSQNPRYKSLSTFITIKSQQANQ
ncbi:DUF1573 domain-containing protein [Rubritalea marina]|uniref:DUF1573 domain-containing protein n=1 Tax=Rubritalea marina TaxID=361055 RepID=UPI00039A56E3|nr:DUF1573 domain-containing protein [Rubritalea marina]